MTNKTFLKKLERIIEDDGEFIVWNSKTMPGLNDYQIAVFGENEDEVFTFEIIKV